MNELSEKRRKVSLLVPFFNEEEVLPELFSRLKVYIESHDEFDWEILMVNDGSTDGGLVGVKRMHAEDPRWRYVDLSRNFGKEVAMLAGFDYVTGDCVVILDADLQDPPEVIDRMLELWINGYDDIYGKRVDRGRESWLRRRMTMAYYDVLQRLTNIPVLQNVGDFRLLDRVCIDALRQMRETQRYTKGLYCWIGFRKAEVEFDRGDRYAGHTKMSFRKLLAHAADGITSYTTMPLRISTFVGLGVSMFTFAYMIYFLVKSLIWGDDVQGFPTLIVVILFLGGTILLCLGILGEYVGRIFNESKRRPPYFVRDIDGVRPRGNE